MSPSQFLPVEELYTPPLNIRLLDHRSFGVKPLVGTHMIKSLQEYRRDPVAMVQTIREKMLESGEMLNAHPSLSVSTGSVLINSLEFIINIVK